MMPSSMFSPTQKLDKDLLLEIAEMISTLSTIDKPPAKDLMEKFAEDYLILEEKIKTFDYSKDDALIEKHESWIKNIIKP